MKRTLQLLIIGISVLFMLTTCEQADDREMTSTPNPEFTVGMLQHTVYFYLNEDVTDEQKEEFEDGIAKLLSIEEIYESHIGIPANTPERDVTDHSFGYSIFVWFESMEDYNVYAEHPIHMDFIDKYSDLWAEVKVYDSEIIQTLD